MNAVAIILMIAMIATPVKNMEISHDSGASLLGMAEAADVGRSGEPSWVRH